MKKRNIAILYGGKSGEHDVSLMSASSVEKHLNKDTYNIILIGITLNGLWYRQKDYTNESNALTIVKDETQLVSLLPGRGLYVGSEKLDIEFIFPILHGTFGEDGTLQGLLDMIDIPYAGSGLDGSYMAMDKEFAKILWERAGIPIVPFIGVKKEDYDKSPAIIKKDIEEKFSYPVFVKPVKAGSSVGVSQVHNETELFPALNKAFLYDLKLLVEPAVNAREIECSIVGNEDPIAYSLGEIAPSHEFYDYDAKYLDPNGAKLIIPATLDKELTKEMKTCAIDAYKILNLKGFSRVDFFLDKITNRYMINEINTIPGFTHVSMFSMLCDDAGLPYGDMLDKLYELGMARYDRIKSLHYDHEN